MAATLDIVEQANAIAINFTLDGSGDLVKPLPITLDLISDRYEAYVSGATALTITLAYRGHGHDVLEGKIASVTAGSAQQGHLTTGIDRGTRGQVPLLIIAPQGSLLTISGGNDASGYLELKRVS